MACFSGRDALTVTGALAVALTESSIVGLGEAIKTIDVETNRLMLLIADVPLHQRIAVNDFAEGLAELQKDWVNLQKAIDGESG
jgi:hypothetical protein